MNELLETWLKGLERGLNKLTPENQDIILKECGKNCADSFPVSVYCKARANATSLETFLEEITKNMPDTTFQLLSPKTYHVFYSKCGCDLVQEKIITTPLICRCSLLSKKYGLEKVFGIEINVKEEQTIVKGGECCQFLIEFMDNPWND